MFNKSIFFTFITFWLTSCIPANTKNIERRKLETTGLSANIEIPAEKFLEFQGQSIKAQIDFRGRQNTVNVEASGGRIRIPVTNVLLNSKQSLTLKFLVDNNSIYQLNKTLDFTTDGEVFTLRSCDLITANWDGQENEGSCNWQIR